MNANKRISVLLAEDHSIVREGLRTLLMAEKDIYVVGEACSGRQAVELTKLLRPEVIVMDVAMPLLNGLEATRQILKAFPSTRILILSAHSDDAYVEQAMATGATGYLVKQTEAHVLPKAIRQLQKGGYFFSPTISRRLQNQHASHQPHLREVKSAPLTSREVEVLQLIAEGKANKETAAELGISVKTVEKHREHLMLKLDIHDTAGLTRYAISTGIIENSIQLTTL